MARDEESHPPATKCAHDFAKGGLFRAGGAGGAWSEGVEEDAMLPCSRDSDARLCRNCVLLLSRIPRGSDAWSSVIEMGRSARARKQCARLGGCRSKNRTAQSRMLLVNGFGARLAGSARAFVWQPVVEVVEVVEVVMMAEKFGAAAKAD